MVSCDLVQTSKEQLACGKRELRNDSRQAAAKEPEHTSAFAFRKRKANYLILRGDHNLVSLPSKAVYNQVKYESKPIEALTLALLKHNTHTGRIVIQRIGLDPFFTTFWSGYQKRLYNKIMVDSNAYLAIDAIGKVSPKVTHVDGQSSQHLFLYSGVLKCSYGCHG